MGENIPPPSVPVKEFASSSFQHPLNKRHPLAMEKIPRERKIKSSQNGLSKVWNQISQVKKRKRKKKKPFAPELSPLGLFSSLLFCHPVLQMLHGSCHPPSEEEEEGKGGGGRHEGGGDLSSNAILFWILPSLCCSYSPSPFFLFQGRFSSLKVLFWFYFISLHPDSDDLDGSFERIKKMKEWENKTSK